MSRFTVLSSLMLAAFATVSLGTGCSPNDPFQTQGEDGVAEFSLSSAQCFLGCSTDKHVLLGSQITVQATVRTHTEDPLFLRVEDATMGSAEPSTQSCGCDGNNDGASTIECSATCPPGKSKSLTVSFDVQTKAAGDVGIQLVDATGTVLDRSSITVHPAKTITTSVTRRVKGAQNDQGLYAGDDGAYTVQVGNQVDVTFQVKDDQGADLAFTRHGVIPTYANAKALAPTTDIVERIIGLTEQEVADAVGVGDGTISLAAQGAAPVVLSFHVVK